MKIANIQKQEVKDYLERLGFQKQEKTMWGKTETYYCWYEGRKRVGNESPTIIISANTGIINMWMNSSFVMREIPYVIINLLEHCTIEE